MFLVIAQVLSGLVAIAALIYTVAIFLRMVEGTDERNSIPFLCINAALTACAWYVYTFLNYLL